MSVEPSLPMSERTGAAAISTPEAEATASKSPSDTFDQLVFSDVTDRGGSNADADVISGASLGMTTVTSSPRRSFSRISLAMSCDDVIELSAASSSSSQRARLLPF